MTLKGGFFDSVGGDRTYSSSDFSKYLEGIITNGFFPNDTGFKARANTAAIGTNPPSVVISPGKAYGNGLWAYNDADIVFYLGTSQQVTPGMKHLVYLCIDADNRIPMLKYVTGTNPVLPVVGHTGVHLPIAMVADQQNAQPIAAHITDTRPYAGTSGTGITTPSLVDGCVTNPKLGYGSVSTDKIKDDAVDEHKLKNGAVWLTHIAEDGVLPFVQEYILPERVDLAGRRQDLFHAPIEKTYPFTAVFDIFIATDADRPDAEEIDADFYLRNSPNYIADTWQETPPPGILRRFAKAINGHHKDYVAFGAKYDFSANVRYDLRFMAATNTAYPLGFLGGSPTGGPVCILRMTIYPIPG